MLMNFKQWLSEYKGPEYDHALPFGQVRLSSHRLFWTDAKGNSYLELDDVSQIALLEGDSVVLELSFPNGEQLLVDIGPGEQAAAAVLLQVIRERFPHITIAQ